MSAISVLAGASGGVAAVFGLAYVYASQKRRYSIVDIVWSYSIGALAIYYACNGTGWLPRKMSLGAMAALWSARLGTHIVRRLAAQYPREDARYADLISEWKTRVDLKMFGVFALQGCLVLVLGTPLFLASQNRREGFTFGELIGGLVWLIAFWGESIADAQLAKFKRNPSNHGKVCELGLWRLSRHPNYFFEWLIWIGFFFCAVQADYGWAGVIAPAAMFIFLFYISGIPPAERQSLKSKGKLYRDYQGRTSVFFPWPKPRS